MHWTTEQKIFITEAYFRQESIHAAQLQFKERFGCREFPEPMGLCITSIVKTLTDNHTLDDRNHQGHHTTLLLSETLLSIARGRQRAVCDNQHRAIRPGAWQVLNSTWSTERGCQGPPVVPAGWFHPPHLKRINFMATAAFPWPTDQPQVWPAVAVVAAFTGLEPPRYLYVGIP